MSVTPSTLLSLPVIGTGTESGTWGNYVNNGLTSYLDNVIAGTISFSGDGAITLANTAGDNAGTNIGSTTAQYAMIKVTGTLTTTKVITAPSYSKIYVVNNAATGGSVTIKASGQSGVSVAVGETATVYYNGTDYVKSATTLSGTGTVTSVAASVPAFLSIAGSPITTSGTLAITYSGTALPVANGGTGLTSGTSGGVPYYSATGTIASSAALTASALVIGGGAGAAPATTTTGTGVVTALGIAVGSSGAFTTNNAVNTFTATQTFSGTSSTFGTSLLDSNETVNVVAAAPSATTNFYVQSGSVQLYTTSAANNWTLNIAFSSGTSMNTALSTGQSVTFTLVTTQGSTAYYNNAVTIDGTSVTPKWIGGAPTAGNASGLDVYRFAVIKTASATYTVLASLTQYK
jgi:hypothetical protein